MARTSQFAVRPQAAKMDGLVAQVVDRADITDRAAVGAHEDRVRDRILAGEPHFLGVDHDDEIAGIHVGGIDRLFFPAQKIGGFHGDLAEDLVIGVDDPPLARNFVGFCRKRLHQSGKGTEITGEVGRCQLAC